MVENFMCYLISYIYSPNNIYSKLNCMKKALLLSFSFALFVAFGFSQTGKYWTANLENRSAIIKNKAVARLTFPTEFKLYHLNLASIKQQLYKVVDNSVSHTTVISLLMPMADLKTLK